MTGIAFRRMTREESRIYSRRRPCGEDRSPGRHPEAGTALLHAGSMTTGAGHCRVHERSRMEVTMPSVHGLRPGLTISGRFAPCDFRLGRSLSPPGSLANLRSLRALSLAGNTARAVHPLRRKVPSGTAEGGGACGKQILLRRDGSLCHTCSLRQPRLRRGPPLRCAPLRPGLGMKRR